MAELKESMYVLAALNPVKLNVLYKNEIDRETVLLFPWIGKKENRFVSFKAH